MIIVLAALITIYIVLNAIVAKTMTISEMKEDFFYEHCLAGKILASICFAPAWLVKAIELIIKKSNNKEC